MREIIFDTETTGLSHQDGDRIIEIGAVEMINRFPTGKTFHHYINPGDREVHPDALAVHGISNDQLKDKPTFEQILPEFLAFFSEGHLVAHNASFDIGFFNAELKRAGQKPIEEVRVVDTLAIARRKFPGAKNSLDALCGRFGISNTHRTFHGALLDSELLADVYIELTGGRQVGLGLEVESVAQSTNQSALAGQATPARQRPKPLIYHLSEAEKAAHAALMDDLGENAIWRKWT